MGKSFPAPKLPTIGDRLRFVAWFAALKLGVDSGQELAALLGGAKNQFSKWVNENPRPSWESIKRIATTVGINAAWLDDPSLPGAVEPEDWAEWWGNRQGRVRRGA